MPYDIEYNATAVDVGKDAPVGAQGGDNIVGTDGNYNTITGARSKVGRLISSEYRLIDGVPFGNKAWTELRRASDTTQNRALLKRYIEDAIKPLVESGEIKDLVVTVDDAELLKGLGAQVSFTDAREGDTATMGVLSPWMIND